VLKFLPLAFEGFHEDLYLGRLTRIPTPALDAMLALVAQRAKVAGL
jgi:hypothetical protein